MVTIKKWKEDSESRNTVKTISDQGDEPKIRFRFQFPKKSRVKFPIYE